MSKIGSVSVFEVHVRMLLNDARNSDHNIPSEAIAQTLRYMADQVDQTETTFMHQIERNFLTPKR